MRGLYSTSMRGERGGGGARGGDLNEYLIYTMSCDKEPMSKSVLCPYQRSLVPVWFMDPGEVEGLVGLGEKPRSGCKRQQAPPRMRSHAPKRMIRKQKQ